ncbi:hypothetical protein BCR35DRAFT_334920 [Leucosporidium creatinivorum]|uniref:Armadillo-type protein n=1 Tax=Leucosporidium creatinivorum TaxID=106004 RepID=A0A1Y2DRQ8_9BASI|nr:hypothetical protein BCR35DRAFT_334920 [Leucosporidium creatinivorum]
MDGLRSPEGSTYGEDSHRTLDYLGLDNDSPIGGFGPFSEQNGGGGELSSLAGGGGGGGAGTRSLGRSSSLSSTAPLMQRLGSTGSLRPSAFSAFGHQQQQQQQQQTRMRSNTVATFSRPGLGSLNGLPTSTTTTSSLFSSSTPVTPGAGGEMYEDPYLQETGSSYHRSTNSDDSTRLLYSTTAQEDPTSSSSVAPSASFSPTSSRTRAATIGILDDSREVFMRRRAGTATGVTPHASALAGSGSGLGYEGQQASEYPGGAASVMARGMRGLSISQDDAATWTTSSRPLTPDTSTNTHANSSSSITAVPGAVSLTPPIQQPTRSLWVGNLDPRTSPAELQAVFAPYGAIESLRLIPEKECGFINFVSVQDAIHAKEDVLNRLGGQLTKTSGMVRIGFGKDAALAGPASSLAHMRTAAGPVVVGSQAPGGNGVGEMSLQTAPTRALWIGSIPASTTPNHLLAIFSPFGPIESARVLTHKSCGFINFERLDDAVSARKTLNGREILGAEVGAVRIGFAKVPTKIINGPFGDSTNTTLNGAPPSNGIGSLPATYHALQQLNGVGGVSVERQVADGALQDYRSNLVMGMVANGQYASAGVLQANGVAASEGDESPIETVKATINETQLLMRELSGEGPLTEVHVQAVAEPRPPVTYYTSIPLHAMNDPRLSRRYSSADAPRLREIRKRLDSQISVEEVDSIAYDLLEECVALSSDYIGNTLIQKIFERASLEARMALLERIAPHLAAIGTHKNGTWAIQKIISSVQSTEEFAIIEQNLAPFTPPLLLNDFGNYVVQGALRFGTPTNDFIFDAMVDRCWEIGSGRFGARSTRQTLENPLSSALNIKRVAIAIILNSIPLATSSNGALLVTWLLDTSNLPGRYRLLAPRFSPHLAHLCTHKLASSAVLKIINQRVDPAASRMLLDAIFAPESKTLEDILGDQIHGTACITKIINSSFVDQTERDSMAERVRTTLLALRVSAVPAYRKLVEELGMTYQGAPSASPPFGSAPNFQPQQQQQQQAPHQQQWMQQQYPGVGAYPPPPMPYGDYQAYGMGYNTPSFQPPYSQSAPSYPYYQASPQASAYPYTGSPYLSASPAPPLGPGGNTSPHLSPAPPLFSPPSYDFSPFSPLGSPSGGSNPYNFRSTSFSNSSDAGGGYYDSPQASRPSQQ